MSVGENLEKIFSLENKVILLTGATGGIGSVLAKGLADAGAEMALCDIGNDKLEALGTEINENGSAKAFDLNILQMDSIQLCVEKVMKEFGRIDVLINCAGINKREGNIINMASHNSVGMLGGCSVYGATKSAVTALTRSMAIEWAKYNIRANAIAPGHILTPLTTVTWEHPERSKYLSDRIAMGRPGTPEEILGLTILLASDSSSYMSGMMYHIDGGCLAGGQPWPYDTKY
ncbi:MAG: short-chain dehydrogenase/reductase [Clostridia bacterium]|nr:short-chain dehydrogenase/reductase [Clostridia bacterium]